MVKVSIIDSSEDNNTFEEFEVVSDLKDASCDYVYFKSHDIDVNSDLLIKAYEKSIENDLDFIMLNNKGFEEEGIYEMNDFKEKIFKTDTRLSSMLIKKSIISNESEDDFDDLFSWDVILSGSKFSFLDESPAQANEMNIDDKILFLNNVYLKFRKNKLLGEYNDGIFNYKLDSLLESYENAGEESKEMIYDKLKEDFTKIIYHSSFTFFTVNISVENKVFFDNVVYSRDFEQFLELMPDYYIKRDVIKLEKDIKQLKLENKNIKKQIRSLERMNKTITSSNSWAVTKPLRGIKKLM